MTKSDKMNIDLDAITARVDAASPGNWYAGYENAGTDTPAVWSVTNDAWLGNGPEGAHLLHTLEEELRPEDARFIAHARDDVPALVAEVRRLRAILDGPANA